MNSETYDLLQGIAKDAGAIVVCAECGDYDVLAFDDEAERRAYAFATAAYKRGEFRCDGLPVVRQNMKSVIDDANHECVCARWKYQ